LHRRPPRFAGEQMKAGAPDDFVLENAKPVVDIELTVGARYTAGLASIATGGDEPAAASGGELGGSRPSIVGLAEAVAERGLAEQRREGARAAPRAGPAEYEQVSCRCQAGLVHAKQV
jgi:hypothetical protein